MHKYSIKSAKSTEIIMIFHHSLLWLTKDYYTDSSSMVNVCSFFSLFLRIKVFLFLFKFLLKFSSTSFSELLFSLFSTFCSLSVVWWVIFGSGGLLSGFLLGDYFSKIIFSFSLSLSSPNKSLLKSMVEVDFRNKFDLSFSNDLDRELMFSNSSISWFFVYFTI